MSRLEKLKEAKSLHDLAVLLGFKPSALAFILYRIPESTKYSEFEILKRSGGKRQIKAPEPRLKALQRRLANLLYACVSDVEKLHPQRRHLSHGFSRSRSIVTNASKHKRRRHVFNVDISDFFPSINFGRVRGFFIKDKIFELDPRIATLIAQITCHDNSLPQGSPCSPVVSNLIGHLLDIRLVGIASNNKCTYTRYADDITFSTNQGTFPAAIARQNTTVRGGWEAGTSLVASIARGGFKLNPSKTRMQARGSRQLTTGLLVNEKVNVRPEYYRTVRSMCSSLFSTGSYYRITPTTLTGGMPGDPPAKITITSLSQLQGMLSHIFYVRNLVDRRDSTEKKKDPTATRELYRRFLFYKNFVALTKPLVITEGKTDAIYLRAAIERMTAFHPLLGSHDGKSFKLAIDLMKYTASVHEVLQLGGGTGDLKFFLLRYEEIAKRFRHCPMMHPVILLIDNDDGAKDLFSIATSQLGVKGLSHTSIEPFYRITKNLYLVKSPPLAKKVKTCIEDLFDPSILATKIDGKSFDPDKRHGDHTKYGKARFAETVVRPNKDSIDFSGFHPLLEGITKVLVDYHTSSKVLAKT